MRGPKGTWGSRPFRVSFQNYAIISNAPLQLMKRPQQINEEDIPVSKINTRAWKWSFKGFA
jgi:hypothetical protein